MEYLPEAESGTMQIQEIDTERNTEKKLLLNQNNNRQDSGPERRDIQRREESADSQKNNLGQSINKEIGPEVHRRMPQGSSNGEVTPESAKGGMVTNSETNQAENKGCGQK